MKRVSLLMTVLCMGGLPLTAAALDYGPDQRMLAAESSVPALPGAHSDENPFANVTAPHRARGISHDSGDEAIASGNDPETPPAAPSSHTARRSSAAPPAGGSSTQPPVHAHGVLSWQSLLPGSIQ